MANLTDFLEPQLVTEIDAKVKVTPEFKELKKMWWICRRNLKKGIFSGKSDYEKMTRGEQEISDREDEIVLNLWRNYHFLPAEMKDSAICYYPFTNTDDIYHRSQNYGYHLVQYSMLPRTKLSQIREVAEKLSFAIVPYEYVNSDNIAAQYAEAGQEAYAQTLKEKLFDLSDFGRVMNYVLGRINDHTIGGVDLYILCPVNFYDPWKEAQDEQMRQKIFGGELFPMMFSLEMMMPMQKNLYQMSKANAKNIKALSKAMKANFVEFKKNLDVLQERVSWVEDYVEQDN